MAHANSLVGHYTGTGSWFDSGGDSGTYRVTMTWSDTATGFTLAFHHDEFSDGSVVDAELTLRRIAPHLFAVESGGNVVGNAYALGGECRYHLALGGKFVECGFRATPDGLVVTGSTTRNAAGNYIAWSEILHADHS